MTRACSRLFRDRRGITSVEFAVVAVLFFTAVLAVIDFGRLLWQWNLATQATRIGARAAAVVDIAAIDLRRLDGTLYVLAGNAVPADAVSPNPTICTRDGCGPALGALNPAGLDATAFSRIVARMQAHDRWIGPANVIVEYRHIGLGTAGNPTGPDIDPLITVRLRDLRFDFMGLAFLHIPPISLPDFRATMTAEDGRGA
jgi:Flp pilus assembly protein TadG